ncbi:MAG: hypothetical protein J6Z09_04535 [Lachnospiraceae bacterium]|nr:hypothetical protein [Lachnospiraceae bacterium]
MAQHSQKTCDGQRKSRKEEKCFVILIPEVSLKGRFSKSAKSGGSQKESYKINRINNIQNRSGKNRMVIVGPAGNNITQNDQCIDQDQKEKHLIFPDWQPG